MRGPESRNLGATSFDTHAPHPRPKGPGIIIILPLRVQVHKQKTIPSITLNTPCLGPLDTIGYIHRPQNRNLGAPLRPGAPDGEAAITEASSQKPAPTLIPQDPPKVYRRKKADGPTLAQIREVVERSLQMLAGAAKQKLLRSEMPDICDPTS